MPPIKNDNMIIVVYFFSKRSNLNKPWLQSCLPRLLVVK